jgi:hypothetical protein
MAYRYQEAQGIHQDTPIYKERGLNTGISTNMESSTQLTGTDATKGHYMLINDRKPGLGGFQSFEQLLGELRNQYASTT